MYCIEHVYNGNNDEDDDNENEMGYGTVYDIVDDGPLL